MWVRENSRGFVSGPATLHPSLSKKESPPSSPLLCKHGELLSQALGLTTTLSPLHFHISFTYNSWKAGGNLTLGPACTHSLSDVPSITKEILHQIGMNVFKFILTICSRLSANRVSLFHMCMLTKVLKHLTIKWFLKVNFCTKFL